MEPDVYTCQQVCERLQISLPTLERLIRRSKLPIVKVGRRVLIRRQAFEELLRQREEQYEASTLGAEPLGALLVQGRPRGNEH